MTKGIASGRFLACPKTSVCGQRYQYILPAIESAICGRQGRAFGQPPTQALKWILTGNFPVGVHRIRRTLLFEPTAESSYSVLKEMQYPHPEGSGVRCCGSRIWALPIACSRYGALLLRCTQTCGRLARCMWFSAWGSVSSGLRRSGSAPGR